MYKIVHEEPTPPHVVKSWRSSLPRGNNRQGYRQVTADEIRVAAAMRSDIESARSPRRRWRPRWSAGDSDEGGRDRTGGGVAAAGPRCLNQFRSKGAAGGKRTVILAVAGGGRVLVISE